MTVASSSIRRRYLREGSVFISPPPREMKLLVPPGPESLGWFLVGIMQNAG